MFQFVCDRCKKPIEGSTYYTVDIYGHDINPTNDGRDSATTYAQNLNEGMSKVLCGEKHYCEECKNKIEDFLRMDDSKTLYIEPIVVPDKDKPKLMYWIKKRVFAEPDFESEDYECSSCGRIEAYEANYCPNCGAEMQSKEKNKC